MSTFLDRARTWEPSAESGLSSDGLEFNIARLRKGLDWLCDVWKRPEPWPADLRQQFALSLDRWNLLEAMTREIYGWKGCPMEPDRCQREGPVVCDACALGVAPATPSRPAGDVPAQLTMGVGAVPHG